MQLIESKSFKTLISPKINEIPWVSHCFTTKIGGVSEGVYESLNLYSPIKEEYEKCLENRKILCNNLGLNNKNLVCAIQVHGNNVEIVKEEHKGRGAFDHNKAIKDTDALITGENEIPLLLLYADCLPIIIADKKEKVVAVVHAGWKSTAKGILLKTLEKITNNFNSDKKDLIVSFGVGISTNEFEINEDVMNKLSVNNFSDKSFIFKNNKLFADLIEINLSQALEFGIERTNLDYDKSFCTVNNDQLFYSYRRDNKITGRHGALIAIKNN